MRMTDDEKSTDTASDGWHDIPGASVTLDDGTVARIQGCDTLPDGESVAELDSDPRVQAALLREVQRLLAGQPPDVFHHVDGQTGSTVTFRSPTGGDWPERLAAATCADKVERAFAARMWRLLAGLLPKLGRPPGPDALTPDQVRMFTGAGPVDYPVLKRQGLADKHCAARFGYSPDGFKRLKAKAREQGLPLPGENQT